MESLVFRVQTARRKVSVWRLFSVQHIEKEAESVLNHMHGIGLISWNFLIHHEVMLSHRQRPQRAFTEYVEVYMREISSCLGDVIKHLNSVTLHIQEVDVDLNAVVGAVNNLREACYDYGAVGIALHCSELLVTIRQRKVARSIDILRRLREETNKLFLHFEVLIEYDEMIFESYLKKVEVQDTLFFAVLFGEFCFSTVGDWMRRGM